MYEYYEGITHDFHHALPDNAVYFYYMWGNGRRASSVFETVIRYSDTGTLMNLFLHPVVHVQGDLVRDVHEDLLQIWNAPELQRANKKVMQEALDGNWKEFRPKPSYPYQRAVVNQIDHQHQDRLEGFFETADQNPVLDAELMQSLFQALRKKLSDEAIATFHKTAKQKLPQLFMAMENDD